MGHEGKLLVPKAPPKLQNSFLQLSAGLCPFQAALGNGLGVHRAAYCCLAVPCVGCFYMGSLNKKVNLFNCGSFKSGLVAGKEGRAGLFNVIATVYTLGSAKSLGVAGV